MKNNLTVLVVNDDGPRSPLLLPLLNAIKSASWCKELRVVIPSVEQSWVAQSINRFREVTVTKHIFQSNLGYLVDGTPADSVSLGIHHLYPNKPDLVISGVNMGTNAGLPFFLSSGTIGGAAEAFLTQVPSISISLELTKQVYAYWNTHNLNQLDEFSDFWKRVCLIAADISKKIYDLNPWGEVDFFSVNIPWDVHESTPRRITRITRGYFGNLFVRVGENQFKHKLQSIKYEEQFATTNKDALLQDIYVIKNNEISITPIKYNLCKSGLSDIVLK
jgi:5'-nucleotidase